MFFKNKELWWHLLPYTAFCSPFSKCFYKSLLDSTSSQCIQYSMHSMHLVLPWAQTMRALCYWPWALVSNFLSSLLLCGKGFMGAEVMGHICLEPVPLCSPRHCFWNPWDQNSLSRWSQGPFQSSFVQEDGAAEFSLKGQGVTEGQLLKPCAQAWASPVMVEEGVRGRRK